MGMFGTAPIRTAQAQADTAKQPAVGQPPSRPAITLEQFVEGVESHCGWLAVLQEAWQARTPSLLGLQFCFHHTSP